ncbi:VVA0879 family protein [Nakamurella sp.]|uniref:VVA0879 family protein n=1 Tax=Nakamurella sp. TaxID=1869182 RepID=UPI003B3B58D0
MTTTTAYRKLTQDELMAEARERFGPDPMRWAFRCPSCGDVASLQDFKDAGGSPGLAGQQCIGRELARLTGEAVTKPMPSSTRGCGWVAYGLISGPWEVVVPAEDGKPERSIWGFPLAEATPVPAA